MLIVLLVFYTGLTIRDDITVEAKVPENRFIKIQDWGNNFVVYDKETKVQYFIYSGGMTVLVDQDGKPLLYEGE